MLRSLLKIACYFPITLDRRYLVVVKAASSQLAKHKFNSFVE